MAAPLLASKARATQAQGKGFGCGGTLVHAWTGARTFMISMAYTYVIQKLLTFAALPYARKSAPQRLTLCRLEGLMRAIKTGPNMTDARLGEVLVLGPTRH